MATNKRDYYEVLGVSKEATEDELKKAYRKRNPNHMNDSIQNLHYKIKKEVSVEIVRENLIECRYPEIGGHDTYVCEFRLSVSFQSAV